MKLLSFIGIVLIGVALALYGSVYFATNEGHVEAAVAQEQLREQLTTTTSTSTTVVIEDDPTFSPPSTFSEAHRVLPRPVPEYELGDPIAEITFPTLDQSYVVVQGGWDAPQNEEALKLGPGHMPWTPLPGQKGNAVISGHRTTYGAPFHDLDLLEPGDPILVGEIEFTVTEIHIIAPDEMWAAEDRGGTSITLTTCNPKGSARQRLVVFADL